MTLWRRLAVAAIAGLGLATWPPGLFEQAGRGQAQAQQFPQFGGPFNLLSHEGREVSDADFRGKLMLISFGYTYCPDVCPTTLQAVSQTMDLLGTDAKHVQPLFITIDPERDTVAALADYVPHFHPSLVGLTGSPKAIAEATKAYRVHHYKIVVQDDEDYFMAHSSFLYLMDREGEFTTLFMHDATPEAVTESIRKYL